MKIAILSFLLYALVIDVVRTVDTYLNLTTGISMNVNIKEVITKQMSSTEYVFILYSNTTIGMYYNQLQYYGRISTALQNRNLATFDVHNVTTSCYYGVVEGGNQIYIIDSGDLSNRVSIKNYTAVKFVFMVYFTSSGWTDLIIYRQDTILRMYGTSTQNTTNFSSTTPTRNYVQKVIEVRIGSTKIYHLILTSLKHVYLMRLAYSSYYAKYVMEYVVKVRDLGTISNFSVLSMVVDAKEVVLVQFQDFQIYAFHMFNQTTVISTTGIQAQVGTAIIRSIYSQVSNGTGRVLIFTTKSLRSSFTCSFNPTQLHYDCSYTFTSLSQPTLTPGTWSGLTYLTSPSSFIFTKGSPYIHPFCHSSLPGVYYTTGCSTTNPVACQLESCSICNYNKTQCVSCVGGYQVYNWECYPIKVCQVNGCEICKVDQTCVKCRTGFVGDWGQNLCVDNSSTPAGNTTTGSNSTTTGNTTTPTTGNDTNTTDPTTNTTTLPNTTTDTTNSSTTPTNSTTTPTNTSNTTTPSTNSTDNTTTSNTTDNDNDTHVVTDNSTTGVIMQTNVTQTNVTQNNITGNQSVVLVSPQPPSPPIINQTDQSNATNQTVIPTNTTNDTLPSSPEPLVNPNSTQSTAQPYPQIFTTQRLTQIQQGFDPSVQKLSTFSSKVNSIPAARQILRFLTPIFSFFDDYWYYIYHQDTYPQLQYMPSFLVFMYSINDDRMIPDYLTVSNPLSVESVKRSNFTVYTHRQVYEIDQRETYFLKDLQKMLYEQYLLFAVGLLVLKGIVVGLGCCMGEKGEGRKGEEERIRTVVTKEEKQHQQNKETHANLTIQQQTQQHTHPQITSHPLKTIRFTTPQESTPSPHPPSHPTLAAIHSYLSDQTTIKNILIILIGSNLIFLSFQFGSQLRIAFAFDAVDCGNVVFTMVYGNLLVWFVVLIAMYEDFFEKSKEKKGKADEGRIWTSYRNMQRIRRQQKQLWTEEKRNCLYITYFSHLKNLLYGFIHGFFINFPNLQYILLILVKIFIICIVISQQNKKHKLIKQKTISISIVCYYVGGILIDILCLLSRHLLVPDSMMENFLYDMSGINMVQIVCLATICLSLVTQTFLEIYLDVKSVFCVRSNRIENVSSGRNLTKSGVQEEGETQDYRPIFQLLRRILPGYRAQMSQKTTQYNRKIEISEHNFIEKKEDGQTSHKVRASMTIFSQCSDNIIEPTTSDGAANLKRFYEKTEIYQRKVKLRKMRTVIATQAHNSQLKMTFVAKTNTHVFDNQYQVLNDPKSTVICTDDSRKSADFKQEYKKPKSNKTEMKLVSFKKLNFVEYKVDDEIIENSTQPRKPQQPQHPNPTQQYPNTFNQSTQQKPTPPNEGFKTYRRRMMKAKAEQTRTAIRIEFENQEENFTQSNE